MPPKLQAEAAIWVCQFLSNAYRPINVFRYDVKHRTIYIQAGTDDDIAVIIEEGGNWEFVA